MPLPPHNNPRIPPETGVPAQACTPRRPPADLLTAPCASRPGHRSPHFPLSILRHEKTRSQEHFHFRIPLTPRQRNTGGPVLYIHYYISRYPVFLQKSARDPAFSNPRSTWPTLLRCRRRREPGGLPALSYSFPFPISFCATFTIHSFRQNATPYFRIF